MKKSKFIEIIKKLIERERKLKEANTTVTAGGSYMTPQAFTKKKGGHKDPDVFDYEKVKEVLVVKEAKMSDRDMYKYLLYMRKYKPDIWRDLQGNIKVKRLMKKFESVNEGKYHDYRNDESLTPRQKIGHSMREVRNALSELNKLIDMNVRLKNELNVDSRSYWKNTHKALGKISERLVKLANKVGKLQ